MTKHRTGTHQEWLSERLALLEAEKDLTRRGDDLAWRGVDPIWGMYPWLDRAPKGRNETGPWWRRHDEYTR
jgi:predicted dithiol-disulfide oxidoreductase (DUF899 family)